MTPEQHDLLAQACIMLGNFFINNADTIAAKLFFVSPWVAVMVSGLIEYRWLWPIIRPFIGPIWTLLQMIPQIKAFKEKVTEKPALKDGGKDNG